VLSQLNDEDDYCLLDAGCGEGYYFDIVYKAIDERTTGEHTQSNTVSFIGLDISKDAIFQATKRNKQISWIVATNRHPPIEDGSVDIILCLFGFLSIEGFSRILKPGGRIILVDPGPQHLKELREIIYDEVKKQGQTDSRFEQIPGFDLVDKKALGYSTKLENNEQVNHLLVMTPHFYRASKQGREHACALTELAITVDVVFRVLQKM
jgi:23S rRNA (guanine745-N1)-methyltransferase